MIELDGRPAGEDALAALALTNYGHFTTLLVEEGRVRGLDLHLQRLIRDCRLLFDTALDPDRVRDLARRAAPRSGRRIIRITVFDPALNLATIDADARPRILVTARPAPEADPGPLRVRTAVHRRDLPEVKSVALGPALRLRRRARREGYDDVLFTGADGEVLEGGTWNIGLVREGRVVWPGETYSPARPGNSCVAPGRPDGADRPFRPRRLRGGLRHERGHGPASPHPDRPQDLPRFAPRDGPARGHLPGAARSEALIERRGRVCDRGPSCRRAGRR